MKYEHIIPPDFDLTLSEEELGDAFEKLYGGMDVQSTKAWTGPIARFTVKADSVDIGARTFVGLASTWDLDLQGEVIERGAFKRTLGIWKKAKGRIIIPLLDQHNRFGSIENVVGKMVEAEETAEGLLTMHEVVDDARGEAVLKRLAGGFINALSVGIRAVRIRVATEEQRRVGVFRFLQEVVLRENSVVIFPANTAARVKSESDDPEASAKHGAKKDDAPPVGGDAPDAQHAARERRLRILKLRRPARS